MTAPLEQRFSDVERALAAESAERRRLEDVIRATRTATWEWNVETGETFYNERWAEILGYTLDELRPLSLDTWKRLTHPEDLATALAVLDRHFRGELDVYECECRMRHKSGEWVWVVDRGMVTERGADGRPRKMFGTHQDITAQVRARALLHAAMAEARAASRAKTDFLATMSHEIRTPLNALLGIAQLLATAEPELGVAEVREYGATMLHSGRQLLRLLDDVLDHARSEAGMLTLDAVDLCPVDVLDGTVALFTEAARLKGLSLEGAWTGPASARYLGDPVRVGQMISNLVHNAIKFTSSGSVAVEGREIVRDGDVALVEFSVTDTGPGIPASKRSQLFEPFSQLDASTTQRHGGSGLGLSIVRTFAEMMSGEVGVDSVEGRGASFWFRICLGVVETGPAERCGTESAAADVHVPSPRPSARLLVAEDNATNRLVIHRLLTRAGYTVECVHDGREALERLRDDPRPDLVLMDVHMPEMDGVEATRRIRAAEHAEQRPRVPILALTASAFDEDRVRCLGAGMDDFLTKPIDLPALHAALARWLPAA
ncbi:response regulator [Myxococcota bacterium]|nr:response regulator [Myxococcota bacterium]